MNRSALERKREWRRWTDVLVRWRRPIVVIVHLGLIALSNYSAFWLRFDGAIPPAYLALFTGSLPLLLGIRALTFIPFRLYEGLWRYTGVVELRDIVASVALSSMLFYLAVRSPLAALDYPRSVVVVDALLLIFLMGGLRLTRRLARMAGRFQRGKRVLIYGAGDAGEMIVRDMRNNGALYRYEPVGFVDDDAAKVGRRIHGVAVLGTGSRLQEIVASTGVDEVLLAMPSARPAEVRRILAALAATKVAIKTLPSLREIRDGRVGVHQIQNLALEDLLERLPVGVDLAPVRALIGQRRVLVTGAGGSIGAELARQVAACGPASLILLDQSENLLYEIDLELRQRFAGLALVPILADVKQWRALRETFASYRPEIVFHAAAYKHVPMMEQHPGEAVLNNAIATKRLGRVAIEFQADRFVLISTDKAVNPSNVMGATKRLGEMYVQALARGGRCGRTIFSAVRFGNVLGSSGSVVPLFLKQIERGGPVTVTHPEVSRYFMTIPEAVELVLRAAALARGGEIFVLEMGEQIRLLDLARHLIRLAGYVPEEEIPIVFTGLRPGEKLREELVGEGEALVGSGVEKIRCIRTNGVPEIDFLTRKLEELERSAARGDARSVVRLLREIVPGFRPPSAPPASDAGWQPGLRLAGRSA